MPLQTTLLSALVRRRPSQPSAKRRLIELPLNRIRGAPVVEPENLVVQIQPVSHQRKSLRQLISPLQINLQVRVEIRVAVRPSDPAALATGRIELTGVAIVVAIRKNIRRVAHISTGERTRPTPRTGSQGTGSLPRQDAGRAN